MISVNRVFISHVWDKVVAPSRIRSFKDFYSQALAKIVLSTVLSFLTILPGFARPLTDSVPQQLNAIADAIARKYVPDKRTDIFNWEVTSSNPVTITVETTVHEAYNALVTALQQKNFHIQIREKNLPADELGNTIYGLVNLSVSNNRKNPDNAAELVTQALLGTPVEVLKKQQGYYLVRTPDRYISWVDNSGVTLMDKQAMQLWQDAPKVVYTHWYGHAYRQPSADSLPVSDLVAGDILQLLARAKGYVKVQFPDKRIAYIRESEIMDFKAWVSRPDPTAEQILAIAKSLNGIPYLWGGTSIKGVDCSGFTKISYFLNGIILPRDASQQALVGQRVDIYEADTVTLDKCLKNLRPGDLLFFSQDAKKTKRITHTAIYMGDGQFIQAAGRVRINSMIPTAPNYGDYRSRTLVSARRILSSIGAPGISRVFGHPFYTNLSVTK
ncbi:NlpC/P60 family protein [Pedobacter sp. BS3]|uniref:C40 family peptidase n=1 Tax=Pedobacter sp. BS3 TaxID=2567937 RepID=UPI0011EE0B0F|nr:C40 family peptidase [Pedobacter sp. BS3]TZF82731.1 NlpC/P60 family protein [Pedobacter sp. BS3]